MAAATFSGVSPPARITGRSGQLRRRGPTSAQSATGRCRRRHRAERRPPGWRREDDRLRHMPEVARAAAAGPPGRSERRGSTDAGQRWRALPGVRRRATASRPDRPRPRSPAISAVGVLTNTPTCDTPGGTAATISRAVCGRRNAGFGERNSGRSRRPRRPPRSRASAALVTPQILIRNGVSICDDLLDSSGCNADETSEALSTQCKGNGSMKRTVRTRRGPRAVAATGCLQPQVRCATAGRRLWRRSLPGAPGRTGRRHASPRASTRTAAGGTNSRKPARRGHRPAAYAYPYYTLHGPRDFLVNDPPSLGR